MSRSVCGICMCPYGDAGDCACKPKEEHTKTVIEMAREIADPEKVDPWDEQSGLCVLTQAELERFAELVRADERQQIIAKNAPEIERINAYIKALEVAVEAEREACAKLCDDFERAKWESVKNITQNGGRLAFAGPMHCAAAIRARGNT